MAGQAIQSGLRSVIPGDHFEVRFEGLLRDTPTVTPGGGIPIGQFGKPEVWGARVLGGSGTAVGAVTRQRNLTVFSANQLGDTGGGTPVVVADGAVGDSSIALSRNSEGLLTVSSSLAMATLQMDFFRIT